MANIKSRIKRNKQNEKRRMRNKAVKSSLKTAIRKFNETVAAGSRWAFWPVRGEPGTLVRRVLGHYPPRRSKPQRLGLIHH